MYKIRLFERYFVFLCAARSLKKVGQLRRIQRLVESRSSFDTYTNHVKNSQPWS